MAANRVLIVDENQAILVIDDALVRKIDQRRGDMSRPEYLHHLIDRQLQPSEAPSPAEYITREEFFQFMHRVRELLRNFLEFFLGYGLDLFKLPRAQSLEELKEQLQELSDSKEATTDL